MSASPGNGPAHVAQTVSPATKTESTIRAGRPTLRLTMRTRNWAANRSSRLEDSTVRKAPKLSSMLRKASRSRSGASSRANDQPATAAATPNRAESAISGNPLPRNRAMAPATPAATGSSNRTARLVGYRGSRTRAIEVKRLRRFTGSCRAGVGANSILPATFISVEPCREFTMNCRPASGIRGRHRQAAQPRQGSVA